MESKMLQLVKAAFIMAFTVQTLETASKSDPSQSRGTVYTRWGRSACPSTADEVVYSGIMGGTHRHHSGGGGDYICLQRYPEWGRYLNGHQGSSDHLHGVEYIVPDQRNIFDKTNAARHHDHDAVCAVCWVSKASAQIMIPSSKNCPVGWTRQYWGYLMTERLNQNSQKAYICVDHAPNVAYGGGSWKDGASLSFVEARCGHALPCPPYVSGRELTCVVCTR